MAAKTIWPVSTLEPGKAHRVKVPDGVDQKTMVRRGKDAVAAFKRRAVKGAKSKAAKAAVAAMEFKVAASGASHVRLKREA